MTANRAGTDLRRAQGTEWQSSCLSPVTLLSPSLYPYGTLLHPVPLHLPPSRGPGDCRDGAFHPSNPDPQPDPATMGHYSENNGSWEVVRPSWGSEADTCNLTFEKTRTFKWRCHFNFLIPILPRPQTKEGINPLWFVDWILLRDSSFFPNLFFPFAWSRHQGPKMGFWCLGRKAQMPRVTIGEAGLPIHLSR